VWDVVVRRELRPVIDALAGKRAWYGDAYAQLLQYPFREMLEWVGLQAATEFDPARFDAEEVNRALGAGDDARGRSVFSSEDPRTTAVRWEA
jgi:hypothetical protein